MGTDANKQESKPDSQQWIRGLFYYNKEDKRIFPPKRIRYLGWTINFANPYSILAFVVVLGFSFLFIKLICN